MKKLIFVIALATTFGAAAVAAAQDFAVVDGTAISAAEYDAALQNGARQKFYHRAVPDAEMDAFRREIAQGLVDRVLLANEVRRRGITGDPGRVAARIAEYDRRYGNSEQWKKNRETTLPQLTKFLEDRDALEQLEAKVRETGAPDEAQINAYYGEHVEQFTQPERLRLSLILLKVDPSSPAPSWKAALEEAKTIRASILSGASFADAARLHSGDPSAERGGDMGYVHKGTMPEELFSQVVAMKRGEVAEPIRVLEGVALFRLEDHQPATVRPLEEVKARAAQLWQRAEAERRWGDFLTALRAAAKIRIDTTRYPALAGLAGAHGAAGPAGTAGRTP